MFKHYLRKLATILGINRDRPARRRAGRSALLLERLESRDLPAPLTWAAGVNLPAAAGGIVAEPVAGVVLTLAGPTTTSENVSVTNPTWKASATAAVQPLDFARTSPGVGTLPNGYLIVFGGTENGFATSAVTQYDPNTVSIPDGVQNQTRSLHSMNQPRALLGWATDTNHISYAIGGQDNNGTPLATVEAYNPTTNTWSYVASLPQTLYSESAVSDGAGHIYTFGGVGANGTIINNVYRYTIATNTWDQVAPLQVGVRDSAAVLGSNGLIYVLGGTTATGATATVESYNISTNTWNVETSLPQAMSSEAATVDSLGRIEVLGGFDANGNALRTIFVSQQLNQPDLAPTITSTPGKTAVVNSAYSYQVLSTANPQATYTLTAAPAGMTINASTGLISWTPGYNTEGVEAVTVMASDSAGQASQTYSITVAPQVPTGLTGGGVSTSAVQLSWNASTDPNVTAYDIYKGYPYHSPRGSGGGINWVLFEQVTGTNSVTISGSGVAGQYKVSAVNSAGVQSAQTGPISVAPYSQAAFLGTNLAYLKLNVGQTGHIPLFSEGGNPASTFSVVTQPPSGGVSVDPVTGVVTYTPTVADIGTQYVTFALTNIVGSSTFTFPFIVQALQPTLTVSGGPVTYDGNAHAATATAIGTDGVTPVNGSFAFSYNGSATAPTAAGSYAVVATFTSTDANYASESANYTLTINPAAPTITVSGSPVNYDGNPHGATATAVGVDGSTAVAGSFAFTYNGSTTVPTGPGLYTVSAAFTSSDTNYSSPTVTSNLIINSPGTTAPTLSLVDGSTTYDGNAHADTGSAVGTDGVTPVNGNFLITYNGSTTAPTAAGSYAVVANFISSDLNYANASITSTLTIGAATPTVTVASLQYQYTGNSIPAQVSAVGVDGATPVNGKFTLTYFDASGTQLSGAPVNAGTYTVAVTFTSNDPNYVSTSTTGSWTILPATPSVGLANGQWQFTYNGQPQGVVGSAVGVDGVTPVAGTFSYSYAQYYSPYTPVTGTPVDAGNYSVNVYFTSTDPNYSNGAFAWQETIYEVAPTIKVTGGTFTYNGNSDAATATAVGIDGVTPVAGNFSFTYNGSTSPPTQPGTYSVVASFAPSNVDYYNWSGAGTLVINKATPAFSNLGSPTVTFGASTVTVSGHITAGSVAPGGDDVAVTLNGLTQAATVSGGGSFSTIFNIQGLSTGTYALGYTYLGDATHFNAASAGSGTLTIQAAPTILTAPASQTVKAGQSVTFTASASGFPAPTVQWQQSTNGTNWSSIAGATSTSYTISATTASQNGYRYRAVFTNSVGSATTAAATLTVQFAPTVTSNPHSATVNAGQTATFTAASTGGPAPTVQWQVSTDGGNTFTNIAGATSTTLTLSGTTASQNGTIYQAVFTNSIGTVTTSRATLTVRYAPIVTLNPTSQTVTAGQSVTFTAAATANPSPTVQWQVSTDGGNTFTNISGATHTTFTLTSTTSSENGYEYRAVFTDSLGSATTTDAILTIQ
jgi:hypothetical protein